MSLNNDPERWCFLNEVICVSFAGFSEGTERFQITCCNTYGSNVMSVGAVVSAVHETGAGRKPGALAEEE